MKTILALNSLTFLFLFAIFGCSDKSTDTATESTAKPVVKKSSVNYTQETFEACCPDSSSFQTMCKTYNQHYSAAYKSSIITYMKENVSSLGEDVNIFNNILANSGCNNTDEYMMPTYAERAKYENKEAWIIQFTYGLGEPNFAHYKCFAIGISNLDTLAFVSCR